MALFLLLIYEGIATKSTIALLYILATLQT